MNRLYSCIILFISPLLSFAQNSPSNFSTVDSLAARIEYKGTLTALTQELTRPFSKEIFKARAIFKWITENIRYDYKHYNEYYHKGKEPKTFQCKDNIDCKNKRIIWETEYINRVLRKKKAVCQGYSMLFKKMCDIAGLDSEVIPGYARTEYYQVGTAGTLDHAWNAVWIDSAYYLLDATWAAGGCAKNDDGLLLSFKKNFNEYYWLTPAADFARNHFPKNTKWTLLPGFKKDDFAANPYYHPGEIKNLKLIFPASGVITAKKNDTIRFKIGYTGQFKNLQINSNFFRNPDIWVSENISKRKTVRTLDTFAVKKQRYVDYRREGNVYEFEYVIPDNSLTYLTYCLTGKE